LAIDNATGLPSVEAVDIVQSYDALKDEELAWLGEHIILDTTNTSFVEAIAKLRAVIATAYHNDEVTGASVTSTGSGAALPWNVKLVAAESKSNAEGSDEFAKFGKQITGVLSKLYDFKLVKMMAVRDGDGELALVPEVLSSEDTPEVQVTVLDVLPKSTAKPWKLWHQHGSDSAPTDVTALFLAKRGDASTTLVFTTKDFSLFGVSTEEAGGSGSGGTPDGSAPDAPTPGTPGAPGAPDGSPDTPDADPTDPGIAPDLAPDSSAAPDDAGASATLAGTGVGVPPALLLYLLLLLLLFLAVHKARRL
jgi:ketosteroid isomerase-like protein